MSTPVTTGDLRKIVSVPSDRDDTDLQPYLDAAHLMRTEDFANAGYSESRLDMIELYLAAHFAVVGLEYGGLRAWQTGQSREEYKGVEFSKVGIESTRWGQQAIALDTSNILIQQAQTIGRAQFTVYSTPRRFRRDRY